LVRVDRVRKAKTPDARGEAVHHGGTRLCRSPKAGRGVLGSDGPGGGTNSRLVYYKIARFVSISFGTSPPGTRASSVH
jgi:hypothetical protein